MQWVAGGRWLECGDAATAGETPDILKPFFFELSLSAEEYLAPLAPLAARLLVEGPRILSRRRAGVLSSPTVLCFSPFSFYVYGKDLQFSAGWQPSAFYFRWYCLLDWSGFTFGRFRWVCPTASVSLRLRCCLWVWGGGVAFYCRSAVVGSPGAPTSARPRGCRWCGGLWKLVFQVGWSTVLEGITKGVGNLNHISSRAP